MALDINKDIIQYALPTNCYYQDEIKKTQIFVHHTAGGSNPFTVIDGWKIRTDHVATAFIIAGKPPEGNTKYKDGQIVQAFSSKNSANHLGLAQKHFAVFGLTYKQLNFSAIGIELTNFGYAIKNPDGTFKNYVNGIIPATEVIKLDKPYKNYEYWHKYTDAQLMSLRNLLIYLCDKYQIPKDYMGDAMFEPTKDCLNAKSGIWTHTSCRPDKVDCSPQPALKKILQTLSLNSI